MFNFLAVLIVIVCVLLTLIVLVQNSKGGGLASGFASSNQIMGVKKTADFLEKATWGLAITLFALCFWASTLVTNVTPTQNIDNIGNKMQQRIETPATPIIPPTEEAPAETKE